MNFLQDKMCGNFKRWYRFGCLIVQVENNAQLLLDSPTGDHMFAVQVLSQINVLKSKLVESNICLQSVQELTSKYEKFNQRLQCQLQ